MIRPLFRWAVLLLTGGMLAGCGMVVRPQQEFQSASKDYVQRLRWSDYQGVAAYLPDADRAEFLDRFAALEGLHFVDVQLASVNFADEGRRADTSLALEFYLLPSITVKRLRLRQEWLYQGGDRYHPGRWQLAGPFPPFP